MIPAAANHGTRAAGLARASSGGNTTAAPEAKYGHSSQTEASNPSPAIWVARSSGTTPYIRRCQRTRASKPRCGTSTPLDLPVEPDV